MFNYRPHVYVGDYSVLTNLDAGPAMFLDLRDPVCMATYVNGSWEPWLIGSFLAHVQLGMTVLDIGSHSGFYTLLAAMRVGPTGVVHAFEPNPFHHRNLLRSAHLNGFHHVQLHRVMLSDRDGEEIMETRGHGGTSIYYPNTVEINEPTRFTVRKAVLTDLIGPSKRVDVIKIDIDGGEPYIMDSLFEVIEASGRLTIFMEYAPMYWSDFAPAPIMQRFIDHGFHMFKIPMTGEGIIPVTLQDLLNFTGTVHWDLMLIRN